MLETEDPTLWPALEALPLAADDVASMSMHGWLWYLTWRRSRGVPLPSAAFMDALLDRTNDPVVRLKIVELAVTNPVVSGESWLFGRIASLRRRRAAGAEAFELAMFFLQIGNETALGYLREMLADGWFTEMGIRSAIADAIELTTAGDEEALSAWRRRLGLENGPRRDQ